jgi:predicted metalloprotease
MDDYLDAITPMVESFFEVAYPNVPQPRNLVYVPRGQGARTPCGVSDSQAYEYCPGNQSIYVGQDLLWAFYRQAGDAAPAIGLAHEWAHHLQFALNLPAFGSSSQSVKIENQADCVAGAWAKYADEQGWLEEKDDLADAEGLLQMIGSAEGPGRDHGTSSERLAAFNKAFKGGITACNSYFPNSPLA